MKKLIAALGLSCMLGTVWAEPVCPTVDEVKATTLDFIAAFNRDDVPELNPEFTYAAMGHLHGQSGNWYVLDGAFKGETTTAAALARGQALLSKAEEPALFRDEDKTNVWLCIYHMDLSGGNDDLPKVIIAANGSVDDLKGFMRKSIS
jgi:hypothetical protein